MLEDKAQNAMADLSALLPLIVSNAQDWVNHPSEAQGRFQIPEPRPPHN
jgi:hypothetical protein